MVVFGNKGFVFATLGIASLSRSEVSRICSALDAEVTLPRGVTGTIALGGAPVLDDISLDVARGERFGDRAAGPSGNRVFLDRHQAFVRSRQRDTELDVERLDEAHVGDGGVDFLRCGERRMQHAAESEQRDASGRWSGLTAKFSFADGQRPHFLLDRHTGSGSSRIAHGARRVQRGARHGAAAGPALEDRRGARG